jgi:opacity protein-like surface antigen
MRAISLGALLVLGFSVAHATAADLDYPIVDEPAPAASDAWNGLYAGVGLTGAYNIDFAETFGFIDGIVGGNLRADSWVVGAEASVSGWKSTISGPGLAIGGELRGGYLVSPDALAYLSGGVTHFVKTGGATYGQIGAGVEFVVAQNTSLDLEYKYWHEIGGPYQTHSLSASVLWHF